MSSWLYVGIVVLYVLVMLGVGYGCMRRTKNVGDFFFGGRTLGPWMSAFAYGTTYFSAVLFIGYAGKLGWGFGIHTIMTLHIRYETALYFLTALTAVYLVMGGYFAVAVSDFIRGILKFGGVMLMVYLLAHRPETGGFIHATRQLLSDPSAAPGLGPVKQLGVGTLLHVAVPGGLTLFALVLITSFGPWALPQMVQKFYSIRGRDDVKHAMIVASIFALFMSFGAYYSGALTHLFYGAKLPAELIGDKGPIWDKIMPHFITTSQLPELLVMIIVLMFFSASMSSLSSLVRLGARKRNFVLGRRPWC